MVRTKILGRLWTDRCDVYVSEQTAQSNTGRTIMEEHMLHQDIPCRVSFRRGIEAMGAIREVQGAVMESAQVVRLFLAPDVTIPPGSRVVVRRAAGQELRFHRTGVPAVFEAHQEVRMEQEERFV